MTAQVEYFEYVGEEKCAECGTYVERSEESQYPVCAECYDDLPHKWRPYGFVVVWDGRSRGHVRLVMEAADSGERRYFWESPSSDGGTRRTEWARMNWLLWKHGHESLEAGMTALLNNPYTCLDCFGRTDSQGRCKCQY